MFYYGFWSSRALGLSFDETADGTPEVEHTSMEPVLSSKEYRRRWAKSSRKYGSQIRSCAPKCGEKMSIIAFIDDFLCQEDS